VSELPPDSEHAPRSLAPATDALREALDGLRSELRARFAEGARGIDWMAFYESLRRRFAQSGMRSLPADVDDFGMDAGALESARPWLDALYTRWWRVELANAERVPRGGPSLFVSNHSGLLPWDGLMICHALHRSGTLRERPRFLVADWLLKLPFAQPVLTRLGGVRACRENAERLLRSGRSVVAFPEGAKGAAKVFRQRYRVQRFGRGGVVRTAIAARVPLVPIAVIGAEEVHPVLFKIETAARAIGLPFVPVTPTFPALGPLGLLPMPSKWWIGVGEPLATDELEPDAEGDEILVWRLTEQLRAAVQDLVDRGLRARASVWG